MIHEIPILRQVREDTQLSPRTLQVWCQVINHLDVSDARGLPYDTIEKVLDIDPTTLTRALYALVEEGYLVRETGDRRKYWTFRVPLSRVPKSRRVPLEVVTDAGVATAEPDDDAAVSAARRRAARRPRASDESVY